MRIERHKKEECPMKEGGKLRYMGMGGQEQHKESEALKGGEWQQMKREKATGE